MHSLWLQEPIPLAFEVLSEQTFQGPSRPGPGACPANTALEGPAWRRPRVRCVRAGFKPRVLLGSLLGVSLTAALTL